MTEDNRETPPFGHDDQLDAESMQQQFLQIQQLMMEQMKTIQFQTQMIQQQQTPNESRLTIPSNIARQVKVPQGNYNMSPCDYRTYRKDCIDYKKLTQNSDDQIVLQLGLNMDNDLKRAIDTTFKDSWDAFSIEEALDAIGQIVNELSNPAVHRKEVDTVIQAPDETVREFITRLKSCAIVISFVHMILLAAPCRGEETPVYCLYVC